MSLLAQPALWTQRRVQPRRHGPPTGPHGSIRRDEGSLEPLDGWIAELARCLPNRQGWTSRELEARVPVFGVGILLRDQTHPLLAGWAERGATLARQLKPGVTLTQ